MRVEIISIISRNKVFVKSAVGEFPVEWYGETPKIENHYEIELGIDQQISSYEINISGDETIVNYSDQKITIAAVIESEDDDGVAYVRFDNDLVMLNLGKTGFVGKKIRFTVENIKAYTI